MEERCNKVIERYSDMPNLLCNGLILVRSYMKFGKVISYKVCAICGQIPQSSMVPVISKKNEVVLQD
jgi:hypothetical protein